MIEMKIVIALVMRDFDIEAVYKELDAVEGKKATTKTVVGLRAYQLGMGQPSENLPCTVRYAGSLKSLG